MIGGIVALVLIIIMIYYLRKRCGKRGSLTNIENSESSELEKKKDENSNVNLLIKPK